MEPEDAFDALHMRAAEQVDAFLETLLVGGRVEAEEAHATADIAYLFAEYLANTYPKLPRDATERDAWVFLYDYAVTQGPFALASLARAPRALGLFLEWLARGERVREIEFLRAACADEEYFRARLGAYTRLVEEASRPGADAAAAADGLDQWWGELDERMRARGLAPDPSLAGGDERWGEHMGPVEAAVFDALCLLLATRARDLRSRRAPPEAIAEELRRVQTQFMRSPNRGLGAPPFDAIMKERASLGTG